MPRAAIRVKALMLIVCYAAVSSAAADMTFWLDFTDFDASPYGFGGQEAALIDDIYSAVAADYSPWPFTIGYDFDPVTPGYQAPTGSYSHVDIGGYDGNAGAYIFGIAEDIDWRNLNHEDSVIIFSSEFDSWNSTYFDNWDRLTNTLAGTTAHEMGHILGLSHHTAFGPLGEAGVPGYTQVPYEGGSETNQHIMATGSTGLSIAERASDRAFGERETWALDAAAGRITVRSEVGGYHQSRETAQLLDGGYSISVTASISTVGEKDWYAFSWQQGDEICLEVFSQRGNRFTDPINPYFELYDPTGSLVGSWDDYWAYSTGGDSVLLDFEVPQTGDWSLFVSDGIPTGPGDIAYGLGEGLGDYELWMHDKPVPEQATCAMVLLGLGGVALRMRRKV